MDIFDKVDPVELTGYVRRALADFEQNQFTLGRYLPNKEIADIDYRFAKGGRGLVDAAVYRTFDTEAPIGTRPGVVRVSGELPPISRKIRQGEYDRLRLRNADDEIVNEVFNDAVAMMSSIRARLELARGDVLVNGSVTISENGVTAEVDYGRANGNTVTAAILWSSGSAVPLTNLIAWRDAFIAANGEAPTEIVMATSTFALLQKNTEVRNLVPRGNSAPGLASMEDVNTVVSSYGLPPIRLYDAQVNVAGVATRVIPAAKVVLVGGGGQLGATLYGVTAEAQELPDLRTGAAEAGITAVATKTFDPVAVWTKASAIALPVLANPNLSFSATVL